MPYDLFISYSRRDDKQGQVRALKEQIEADYRSFAKEDLRCFFDTEDIATMDDWRHRILEGLRESNLLLLALSPAYLDSPYCEWEIVEFLKYEHSRTVGGQGVTPVHFVEIPFSIACVPGSRRKCLIYSRPSWRPSTSRARSPILNDSTSGIPRWLCR